MTPSPGATFSPATSSGTIDTSSIDSFTTDLLTGLGGTSSGVTPAQVTAALTATGLLPADPRLASVHAALSALPADTPIPPQKFLTLARDNLTLLHRVASRELAVPDFPTFAAHIGLITERVAPDTSGAVADYIPTLAAADPDLLGVTFCSVDGQVLEIGDTRTDFSVQSTTKAVTFAAALDALGADGFAAFCGVEPSGRPFNDTALLPDERPPNPMVNAGALMTAACLASHYPDLAAEDAAQGGEGAALLEEALLPVWRKLTAHGIVGDIGVSKETYTGEKATADQNKGLAYLMTAKKGLPGKVTTETMLDFYLRTCSIETNCAAMAVLAATLGNGGRNPVSNEAVYSVDVVQHVLSVMTFCGQYDGAGEFFLHSGMPSKSGVSGIQIFVLPNLGAFSVFSPRLNEQGNSVRGVRFARELVKRFTFHMFDSLSSPSTSCKLDPRFSCDFSTLRANQRLRWAVEAGDRKAVQFSDFLIEVCIRVALCDGSLDEEEIAAAKGAYEGIMGIAVDNEKFEASMSEIDESTGQAALDALGERAAHLSSELTDNQKGIIIEAAFAVAVADGEVDSREKHLLASLSDALGMMPEVMELRLRSWENKKVPSQKKASNVIKQLNSV